MELADPYLQVIELDASSHTGYRGKYHTLHGMGRHREAFEAFRTMLSKLEQSLDPQIHGRLFCQYCTSQQVLNAVDRTLSPIL